MPHHEILNVTDHRKLRVNTQRAAALGDNISSCWVYAFEMHLVQTCYPVFFQKHAHQDSFIPVALFGFEPQKNLFLTDRGWEADYIPLLVQREPFSIGQQQQSDELVIHIDTASPRISEQVGEPIFEAHGGHSQYLHNVTQALKNIHLGEQQNREYSVLLTEHNLIEPVFIDIPQSSDPNAPPKRLHGFYTINEDVLNTLEANALQVLQQAGLLKMIYLVLASQQQMPRLIARYQHQQLVHSTPA